MENYDRRKTKKPEFQISDDGWTSVGVDAQIHKIKKLERDVSKS